MISSRRIALPLVLVATLAAGCSAEVRDDSAPSLLDPAFEADPGFRICCVFGYNLTPVVPLFRIRNTVDPSDMGPHSYGGSLAESDGLIYTQRGGFVDTGHMRDYADWVAHLANSLKRHPRQPVDLPLHAASRLQVTFRPPAGPIDDDLVIRVAKRVAFEFSVWHEIATWYGWRQVPIYPEAVSAFSPEDLYSNLLGATIGERALRAYLNADAGADYSTLVQRETRALLTELGEVSQSETERLLDTIEGEDGWWDRTQGVPRFKGVTRRHLDLGETVVPWLVPGSREAPTPLTVGSLGAEGRPLGDFYTLQVEVDKSAVPALTLHSGPTIKSTEFKGIVERLRKDVLHRLGPMADSPDRVHTVTFSADRRIRAFRPTQSSWQVRVEELSGGDWRPSYQRSFVTLTDLGRYLSRTPEGRRLLSKLKAE